MGLTPYTTTEIRVNPVEIVAETGMDAVKMDLTVKLDTPAKVETDRFSKATLAGGPLAAIVTTNRTYRVIFWVLSALVLLALGFPYLAPLFD